MSVRIQSLRLNLGCADHLFDFLLEISEFFNVSTNYLVFGVHTEAVEDKKLKKDIDEAIEKIEQTIEKLLEKKEELLQMKKNYNINIKITVV